LTTLHKTHKICCIVDIREIKEKTGIKMALTTCRECKKEVSTSAKTCPHCGIKNPALKAKDTFVGVIGLIVLVGIVYSCSGSDKPKQEAAQNVPDKSQETQVSEKKAAEELAACKLDLQCWGEKNLPAASVYCKTDIEKLGKFSSKWTDGMLEMKFSRYRWLDKSNGTLTFIGDKIEFQNGFGAFQPHIYTCDFDPTSKSVLAVHAVPGRL
jgi:hypothetical protein